MVQTLDKIEPKTLSAKKRRANTDLNGLIPSEAHLEMNMDSPVSHTQVDRGVTNNELMLYVT